MLLVTAIDLGSTCVVTSGVVTFLFYITFYIIFVINYLYSFLLLQQLLK